MVRQISAWMVMGALVAGLTAPAFAQGTTPAAPATPAKPATPAAPAAKAPAADAMTKSVRGTLKSVAPGSLVVSTGRDKNQKDMTFALGPDTKYTKAGKPAALKDLVVNDAVKVDYTEAAGKLTAKDVMVRSRPAKGSEAKPKS
jgi:hypothetical protein